MRNMNELKELLDEISEISEDLAGAADIAAKSLRCIPAVIEALKKVLDDVPEVTTENVPEASRDIEPEEMPMQHHNAQDAVVDGIQATMTESSQDTTVDVEQDAVQATTQDAVQAATQPVAPNESTTPYTKVEVRKLLSKLATINRDAIKELLSKYGADNLSTLDEKHYAAIIRDATAMMPKECEDK